MHSRGHLLSIQLAFHLLGTILHMCASLDADRVLLCSTSANQIWFNYTFSPNSSANSSTIYDLSFQLERSNLANEVESNPIVSVFQLSLDDAVIIKVWYLSIWPLFIPTNHKFWDFESFGENKSTNMLTTFLPYFWLSENIFS